MSKGLTLSKKQALAIWHLLLTGEEPSKSEWRPKLDPRKERKPLEQAGLIRYEKRGRRQHVIVTGAAWDWAAKNLIGPISDSPLASKSLMALLAKIQKFLDERDLSFHEIVERPRAEDDSAPKPVPQIPLDQRLEMAYLDLSQNKYRSWIRLADLRKALSDVTREALDQCLLQLQDRERIYLFAIDDRARLTVEDEAHAIWVAGEPKHTVYFEPST